MTKELLQQLSTGDFVKNIKTNEVHMISVVWPGLPSITTIEKLTSLEDWELERSRLVMTKEDAAKIKKYHEDLEKQTINKK